ncbi:MAG TPA: Mur ligase family protein, partial [Acidimicrobiales bacterium]|nr:Mur ligase family protein [Acidimicrobiales bacterium]
MNPDVEPLTEVPERVLLVGFGLANQAVATALLARGHEVSVADDRPSDAVRDAAATAGLVLVEAPDEAALEAMVVASGLVVAAPGLPDQHAVFALARRRGVPTATELDLAAVWDRRPIVAITGTNGKTTVTTLVTAMLRTGGIACVDAGNNDLPLVTAIDDPVPEWFVVEASSFRLGRTHGWAPRVATWLNLAPDHLDVHATHADYEAAKARIWAAQTAGDVAVGTLDDPVVARHLRAAAARQVAWSTIDPVADYHVAGGELVAPGGTLLAVEELPRALGHDVANALAAAATAEAAGCDREAVRRVLREA